MEVVDVHPYIPHEYWDPLMAGRGPAPAGQRSRERDNAKSVKLTSDGKTRGPALPRNALVDKQGNPETWHKETIKWWNHWRRSPQAIRMMTAPDWDFLLDTALMHHEMWRTRRFELAGEIRLRVQQFGATPEARARLRFEVAVPAPDAAPAAQPSSGAIVSQMGDERWKRLADEDD